MSTALTTTASNAFATIDASELDTVAGGAGVNANVDVKLDGNQAIDSIGAGAQRLLGCATGSSSMKEFGSCILTGQLGGPAAPQTPTAGQ